MCAISAVVGNSLSLQTVLSKLLIDFHLLAFKKYCLQCFDAVGWAAGRASGL